MDRDYYFMSLEEFQHKILKNEFIEWEMVYEGKYYGTLKSEMERIWTEGKVPVLDIDVKGRYMYSSSIPTKRTLFLYEPPSIEELKKEPTGQRHRNQGVARSPYK